jgi:kinesin family protein 3/17
MWQFSITEMLQISDLLKPERSNLTIREDKKRGVFVEGLSEWVSA